MSIKYSNDKVSIIIPLYNNEKYIVKCVESVFKQVYGNIEIIVVDDGSTDNGIKYVEEKFGDKKIIVIQQKNSGPSAARNMGLSVASGKWILFLDSDDELAPNSLNKILPREEQVDLVIAGWKGFYKKSTEYYGPSIESLLTEHDIEQLTYNLVSNGLYYQSEKVKIPSIEGPVAKLYLNDIIKKNNILFTVELNYAEDVVFNFKYLQHCNKVKCYPEIVYYASRHMDSLSNRKRKLMEIYSILKYEIDYANLKKSDLNNYFLQRKFMWIMADIEIFANEMDYSAFKKYLNTYKFIELEELDVSRLTKYKKTVLFLLNKNTMICYVFIKICSHLKAMKNRVKYG